MTKKRKNRCLKTRRKPLAERYPDGHIKPKRTRPRNRTGAPGRRGPAFAPGSPSRWPAAGKSAGGLAGPIVAALATVTLSCRLPRRPLRLMRPIKPIKPGESGEPASLAPRPVVRRIGIDEGGLRLAGLEPVTGPHGWRPWIRPWAITGRQPPQGCKAAPAGLHSGPTLEQLVAVEGEA
jgi:hypothetical protein